MLFPIFANNPNKNQNLGFSEKFAYGLGDFASNIMWAPAAALLLYYYTEFVGVNIAIVATIMFFSRFLDGFSDLFVGWLVERTNSPYGKTRVWILRMIVPFFIAMVAMFSVPSGMGETFKYVYIFFSYNFAITVVYTAINLPYGALTTAITSDSYQRSIITIYRMIFSTTGYTLSMLVALPMVEFFGNDQFAWSITFAILGAIACLSFFITFIFCQERIVEPPAPKTSLKKTLSDIKEIFHNKYWLYLTQLGEMNFV
ncbi:MFS transporter [Anaerobiospirillum sp. NML120448]|uniref:MFS transporter n=1 Tax=Anaerobiospirillum sp. NML120448 TaxID=2932816 RepID=UPI001FF17072|nr:MFS transporter [Anaerobiospirillum sp. NML120448]MCK0513857.1 MFS transporter [Anaerobiospirillum sp. NML120448]